MGNWQSINQTMESWSVHQWIDKCQSYIGITSISALDTNTKQFTPNQSNKQFVYYWSYMRGLYQIKQLITDHTSTTVFWNDSIDGIKVSIVQTFF